MHGTLSYDRREHRRPLLGLFGESSMAANRPALREGKRLVLKIGTRVLTKDDGSVCLTQLSRILECVSSLHQAGREVLIVSSGAVGLGKEALRLKGDSLIERQACAAVGQSRLMSFYDSRLQESGIHTAQILLSEADFDNRTRYLNLRNTLSELLHNRVIPILNENDALSVNELAIQDNNHVRPVFGDNDRLSALVAAKLDADLLVLLTDVEGVFDSDPNDNPDARLVSTIQVDDPLHMHLSSPKHGASKGGMQSKVESALIAAKSGCTSVILSGRTAEAFEKFLHNQPVGTLFPATVGLPAKRRWIAWATAVRGQLIVDDGARKALTDRGASLLAVGVHEVQGSFQRGDVVEILGLDGQVIGRGIIHCDTQTAQRWIAGEKPVWSKNHDALVHRNNLVLRENRESQ